MQLIKYLFPHCRWELASAWWVFTFGQQCFISHKWIDAFDILSSFFIIKLPYHWLVRWHKNKDSYKSVILCMQNWLQISSLEKKEFSTFWTTDLDLPKIDFAIFLLLFQWHCQQCIHVCYSSSSIDTIARLRSSLCLGAI